MIVWIAVLFISADYFWFDTKKDNPVVSEQYRAVWSDVIQETDAVFYSWWKILFFGDLIYDRGVQKALPSYDVIKQHFAYRYDQKVSDSQNISTLYNIAKTYDFVWLNLETPVAEQWISDGTGYKLVNYCQRTDKTIAFCSNEMILPVLKKLWFTMVNLINNHTMDGGITAHLKTIEYLNHYGLQYFGTVGHGKYFDHAYILTGQKDGNYFARHGFDITIYKWLYLERFCRQIQQFENQWYHNFVSFHRGKEYEHHHSERQETVAHKIIDCGADLVIGHHPHVVQDIGRYKWIPIVYSLGNFLFDQSHRDDTQTGWYVIIEYPYSGNAKVFTGKVPAYAGDKMR